MLPFTIQPGRPHVGSYLVLRCSALKHVELGKLLLNDLLTRFPGNGIFNRIGNFQIESVWSSTWWTWPISANKEPKIKQCILTNKENLRVPCEARSINFNQCSQQSISALFDFFNVYPEKGKTGTNRQIPSMELIRNGRSNRRSTVKFARGQQKGQTEPFIIPLECRSPYSAIIAGGWWEKMLGVRKKKSSIRWETNGIKSSRSSIKTMNQSITFQCTWMDPNLNEQTFKHAYVRGWTVRDILYVFLFFCCCDAAR